MNNHSTKRKVTSLLLLLAMLITCFAAVLPVVSAASELEPEPEFKDFGYQQLLGATLKDEKTNLRFLFSIKGLDYTGVGFVFSSSNSNPEKSDDPEPNYITKTVVHSRVTAMGKEIVADPGRYWVTVSLAEIPHANFDDTIYVRPFVVDAEGTRYGTTESITVCRAYNHAEHVMTWDAAGSATLISEGDLTCTCPVCDLTATFHDVKSSPVVLDSTNPEVASELLGSQDKDADVADKSFLLSKSIGEIRGEKTFHPTDEDPYGNDLWFEYSFLMNESFWNYNTYKSQMKAFNFRKQGDGAPSNDKQAYFYYLYANDNLSDRDCPYKGHFDYSTYFPGQGANCALSPDNGEPVYKAGWAGTWDDENDCFSTLPARSDSPYLYDEESADAYGWHRLGFHYHQDATIDNDKGGVVYNGYTELYVDGVKVWKVQTNMQGRWDKTAKKWKDTNEGLKTKGLLLWTAEIDENDENKLVYTDNDSVLVQMYAGDVMDSETPVILAVGDVYWTCGKDGFQVNVKPKADPTTGEKVAVKGDEYGFFYEENDYVSPISNPKVYESTTSYKSYNSRKSLTAIRGEDHFYPDATNSGEGRDLYFEYDFLWNDSLYNWDNADALAEIKVVTVRDVANEDPSQQPHREFYYLYTRDKNKPFFTSTDCPYQGHFDYSTYKSDDLEADNAEDLTALGNTDIVGNPIGKYAAGWSVSRGGSPFIYDSEWFALGGWHRIGVLIHQEAKIETGNVVYSGYTELYIDGVKVWKVQTAMEGFYDSKKEVYKSLKENGLLFFTAEIDENDANKLVYTDAPETVQVGYQIDSFMHSATPAFALYAETNWRIVPIGFDPSTEIERIDAPAEASYAYYTLPSGQVVASMVFFRAK